MRISKSRLRNVVRSQLLLETKKENLRKSRREEVRRMKKAAKLAVDALAQSGEIEEKDLKRVQRAAKRYGRAYKKLARKSMRADKSDKKVANTKAVVAARVLGKIKTEFPDLDEKIIDIIADWSALDAASEIVAEMEKEDSDDLYTDEELSKMMKGGSKDDDLYSDEELSKMMKGGTKKEKVKILVRDSSDSYEYAWEPPGYPKDAWYARKKGSEEDAKWHSVMKWDATVAKLEKEFSDEKSGSAVAESIISRGDLRNIIYEVISADQPEGEDKLEGDPSTNKELKKATRKEQRQARRKWIADDREEAKKLKKAAKDAIDRIERDHPEWKKSPKWKRLKRIARQFVRADKKWRKAWQASVKASNKRILKPNDKRKFKEQTDVARMKATMQLRSYLREQIPGLADEMYEIMGDWAVAEEQEKKVADTSTADETGAGSPSDTSTASTKKPEEDDDGESHPGAGRYDAEGVEIFNRGKGWDYSIQDDVWHTRKSGTDGRWISLAASKWADTRNKLDGYFPGALAESTKLNRLDVRKIIRKEIRRK